VLHLSTFLPREATSPLQLSDFDYALPPERIAQEPLPERDQSRLLWLRRSTGAIEHRRFLELPELLRPGDLLVVNNSRVFPARLLGRTKSGARVELLLLHRREDGFWEALGKPGRRLRPGARARFGEIEARVVEAGGFGRLSVELDCQGELAEILERIGHTPLPPYIKRAGPEREPEDRERYQTVYARERGSIAAPTAGLHFTPAVLHRLGERGIERAEITLHVGYGTFQPLRSEQVEENRLQAEPFVIPEETAQAIERARARRGRVVAVGTTTVRALESAATPAGAEMRAGARRTALFIYPGFSFGVVDGLVTNFHLPRSSLLLLVSAFAGVRNVRRAYEEAVREGYRFYSYGDTMLISD